MCVSYERRALNQLIKPLAKQGLHHEKNNKNKELFHSPIWTCKVCGTCSSQWRRRLTTVNKTKRVRSRDQQHQQSQQSTTREEKKKIVMMGKKREMMPDPQNLRILLGCLFLFCSSSFPSPDVVL